MPTRDEIQHLRLVRTEGVGPVTYRRLLARYRSPTKALEALPHLVRSGGKTAPAVIPKEADATREFEQTAKLGGRLLFLDQPDYPPGLAALDDAPPCLAVLGDVALLLKPAVAIVGGRNASANGLKFAERLAEDLARHVTIVSGLARGIDAISHTAAMRTGRTVAAIAGGLDVCYPAENVNLQRLIGERGAVVTEATPGTQPQARHFPRRNRLIAGLSIGVVVVEAAQRSGSLITAQIARDQGREVFAVPGSPMDPRARGGNDLLRQGAVLTESARDVLDHLAGFGGLFQPLPPPVEPADSDYSAGEREIRAAHEQVLALLGAAPTAVDDLVRRCQLCSAAVMAALLELELAGRVETLPGNRIVLLPPAGTG